MARRRLRQQDASGDARVHVTIRARSDRSGARRPTTRMATESDASQVPQIVFPDNETFVASDVDFAALFPTAPPRFTTVRRFSCTRCQLAQVPTMLFGIPTLSDVNLSGNAINDVPVQFEDSAITSLNLADNEFADVPAEVWAIPQLRVLDLSRNRVTACASPATSATIRATADNRLQILTLDGNPLKTFTCRFPELQTLSLHNTSLEVLPRALKDYTKLRRLIVSGNPALDLTSKESLTLANLNELDLSSNGLSTLPAVLRILTPNLQTLILAKNNISDPTEDALAVATSLPNLTTIVLDGNNVQSVTTLITQFPLATNLSLASNNISEVVATEPVESLLFLNLSGNAIKTFKLTLPRLETLDLSNNSLSSVSSAIFALRSLRELYISGNPIEPLELTPAQFSFLSGLKSLTIDQTAFASCAVQNQRSLRGNLKVCVSPSAVSTPSETTAAPSSKPATSNGNSRSSTGDQLLYLGGSFLIAIFIALWIFSIRRRRARAAEAAASSSSQSARGRASSSMRSPHHGISSSSRPVSSDPIKSRRSGSRSEASGQSRPNSVPYQAPLSEQNVARAASNQSTFWEDEELQAWRVEFNGVKMQTKIASGVFTEVWRASYRTDTVAVKKLKASLRVLHQHHPEMLETGVLDDFIFEIRVLSRLNHPRIVAFYGAAWTSESELTAIMEYMPQQDLRGFLNQRQYQSMQRPSNSSRNGDVGAWSVEMVHMALCVAEALTCLHSQEPPLVHGNVQAKNVLLDEHMDSKLCDFGSAQYCSIPLLSFSDRCVTSESDEASSSFSLASVRADATPWIPPEVLRSQAVCDPSIDIYAFGVLLAEIDTNEVPYAGSSDAAALNDLEVRRQVAIGSLRPAFTSACPLSILALATRCLAFEPQDRPTSTDVTFALREIIVELERQSHASVSTQEARSTIGPLLNLQSTDSSVSDSDMSQRTIDFRRYSSA